MKVAGFDIGGANTDLAVVDFENNEVKNIEVDFAYLPMWSNKWFRFRRNVCRCWCITC